MKKTYDETMLSAYIDGELDAATMHEVDLFLEQDHEAGRYMLDTIRARTFTTLILIVRFCIAVKADQQDQYCTGENLNSCGLYHVFLHRLFLWFIVTFGKSPITFILSYELGANVEKI